MNKSNLTFVFASLILAVSGTLSHAYAADISTKRTVEVDARTAGGTENDPPTRDATPEDVKNNARNTLHGKADINPRDAGGTENASGAARTTGMKGRDDIDARNAGGTNQGARSAATTSTTTSSQSMANRNPDTTTRDGLPVEDVRSGPSSLVIFFSLLVIAVVAAFGIRSYRQRNQTI